ncbi:MAG: hypothetical protein ABIG34_02885 [Candidatus Peregrinibacteria bacterium]
MRSLIFSVLTCCLLIPAAGAQEHSSAASSSAGSGSVVDIWAEREERAASFKSRWSSFALVHTSWITKWQKAHGKLITHIDRCHDDVRSANRDTLLPVTLQCYRGQLMIERDSLKNERDVIDQWPSLPAAQKAAMLASIDALQEALQPVTNAIDAKVFTTLDAFRDVRANLRTQYRLPYWLAAAQVRASAARTWLDHLLLSLKSVSEDASLPAEVQQHVASAMECYEAADPLLFTAQSTDVLETSRKNLSDAIAQIGTCSPILAEAQQALRASSSSSSH